MLREDRLRGLVAACWSDLTLPSDSARQAVIRSTGAGSRCARDRTDRGDRGGHGVKASRRELSHQPEQAEPSLLVLPTNDRHSEAVRVRPAS